MNLYLPERVSASVSARLSNRPFAQAFTWAGLWLVVLILVMTLATGHVSAYGIGRFVSATMMPAVIVGFIASLGKTPWSLRKSGAIYSVTMLVLLVLGSGALHH